MAALTITESQVLATVNDPVEIGVAAEAITIGQAVAYAADLEKWTLAQAQCDAQVAGSDGYGIALTRARAYGQPLVVALPGHRVTLGAGAAPAAGVVYYLGPAVGGIFPVADLISADCVLPLCIGIGSNKVKIIDDAYHPGSVLA